MCKRGITSYKTRCFPSTNRCGKSVENIFPCRKTSLSPAFPPMSTTCFYYSLRISGKNLFKYLKTNDLRRSAIFTGCGKSHTLFRDKTALTSCKDYQLALLLPCGNFGLLFLTPLSSRQSALRSYDACRRTPGRSPGSCAV